MKIQMRMACALAIVLVLVPGLLMARGSREAAEGPRTFTVWHYESETGAMGQSWELAMQRLREMHPEVQLDYENKGFEQIRQTAQMVLSSSIPPDVMEYNKGNATAGLLSSQGLLEDLTREAEARGWDRILSPSLQVTSRYSDGVMGDGAWYGVTNYGEFVMAYYNRDMFAEYGISIPETLEDFEHAMQQFVDAGITPLAMGGAEYPAQHVFYLLALNRAEQSFIDAYQLYTSEVDFRGPELTFAAEKMVEWLDRGFYSQDAISMGAEDMGLDFVAGRHPIMISGSWWFGRFMTEITAFDWGTFLFPGNRYHAGSGGNLWVVPANAQNQDLAYDFIDITLSEEVQNLLGNAGGIPIAADPAKITDPQIQELIRNFNDILEMNGLAFYPDWPVPGYYDVLVAEIQHLMAGTKTVSESLDSLGAAYRSR